MMPVALPVQQNSVQHWPIIYAQILRLIMYPDAVFFRAVIQAGCRPLRALRKPLQPRSRIKIGN